MPKEFTHEELGRIHRNIAYLTKRIRDISTSLYSAREERDALIAQSVEIQKYFMEQEKKIEVIPPSRSSKSKGKAKTGATSDTPISKQDILAYIKQHGKEGILEMLGA